MQVASKIVNCLATYARDAIGKKNTFNIGTHCQNYLRACIWLGQAYLTRFTVESTDHVFIEVPIEGLIKLTGFGAGAFKNANMLPLPKETWRQYLERLPAGAGEPEEGAEKTILNKASTMRGLLQRYIGTSPQILDREVPRAEGVRCSFDARCHDNSCLVLQWNESSSIDSTHCLKLVMENLLVSSALCNIWCPRSLHFHSCYPHSLQLSNQPSLPGSQRGNERRRKQQSEKRNKQKRKKRSKGDWSRRRLAKSAQRRRRRQAITQQKSSL